MKITNKKEHNQIKLDLKTIFIFFLISRIILIMFLIIKKDLYIFELYDAKHYIQIAKTGYIESMLYAFFPLYPLLIRLLSFIIPSYTISGALISNISAFFSVVILNELTKDKNNIANILSLIFTPILAYTSIVYTESLFILLTFLGYYLYKKEKYLLSSIIVGLSMLTRNSGIILYGAIGLDMLYRCFINKEIKLKKIIIFGIVALLIGIMYPLYLYIETGDFLKFVTVQMDEWHRISGTTISNFISDLKVLNKWNSILFIENWATFIFAFIIGIKQFKEDKASSIYIIVSLLAFTFTYRDTTYWTTLASISLYRFVLALFPIYIYLLGNKKESPNKLVCYCFCVLSIVNTILIYRGLFLG